MASRSLTRSKTLTTGLSNSHAAPPLAGARWLRLLFTLPRDPAAPSPRQGFHLGLGKMGCNIPALLGWLASCGIPVLGYEQISRVSGTQVLTRWFSTRASNGPHIHQTQISQTLCKTVAGMEHSDALKAREGASSEVVAFSPLEAAAAKPRSNPLTSESSKVRRSELATKVTFYMIPTLLLVSKNSISTSLLILSVFHQVYMFHKEIFLDYIHHEITRKWVLIYFKLLLLIMAKDTMVYFNSF